MSALIGWVAVGLVALFFLFILKRVIVFFFGRRHRKVPLHEDLVDMAEDVAGASRVAAALASAATFFAAPAGLLAVAAAFGFVAKPLIVVLLPTLLAFAFGAAALSAAAKLFAKIMRKRR